jgi:hypothetical protein
MDKFVTKVDKNTASGRTGHQQHTAVPEAPTVPVNAVSDHFNIPTDRFAREEYIRRGPIRPVMSSYPQSHDGFQNRSFSENWYVDRPWLEYNQDTDSVLCFACRLFGSSKHDPVFQTVGFRNWKVALTKKKGLLKHAESSEHETSMIKWEQNKLSKPIDTLIFEKRRKDLELGCKDRQERHDVLPILLDITNTLTKLRLPFRGHNEEEESSNRGVFLEVTNLVARWNTDLSRHLEKAKANPKGYPSYTSPPSQNEMIKSCAAVVRQSLVQEILKAVFFAVCLDTTPDAGKMDQLSVVIRYLNEDGEVIEALLEMVQAEKCDAASIFQQISVILASHGLDIQNLRGQGYDGCSTMSGKYTGLQARIKEVNPFAYFVHCAAHRLNLVVVDTCAKNVTARNFFGTVEQLYAFIEGSTKRHGLFKEVQTQLSVLHGEELEGTLHSLCTTRWATRADNCAVLEKSLPVVATTLQQIKSSDSYNREIASHAAALLKAIDFEFCLCLSVLGELLELCNISSKYLQAKDMDISLASLQIEALIAELESFRTMEEFERFWAKTELIAHTIDVEFVEPRRKKASRRIEELWQTEVQLSAKDQFRVEFYYATIDLMLISLRSRFSADVLPLLKSIDCLVAPAIDKIENLKTLANFYKKDVQIDVLLPEYRLFVRSLQNADAKPSGVHQVFLHMVASGQCKTYPSVARLYRLVLTLPATSCSCERSFSALKFVKNNLRTTMSQDRLQDLMLLAVEAERTKCVEIHKAVDYFWNSFEVERR